MKLHIKIVLTIIVTLLLLIYLSGFMLVFSQAPTNWVITGRVMAPSPETAEDISVTNAIVTLTDIEGDIHIVTTGKDGYYFFKNLAVDANCVITAIAIVNVKTMVFKDVIPRPVAAYETYDAGTADAESTALALIVEELTKQGLTHEDIDLEIIQDSENFKIVGEQVLSVLEDNRNVMEDIIVAGEEVVSGEAPESVGVDASDFTVNDEKGMAYKVTVTLRERISDDESIAATAAQTTRGTYTITASVIGSGTIEPGTVTVNNGSSQTFTITQKSNYHIVGITVDGNLEVGPFVSPYEYTFDNVTDDHTIEAYLAIDNYAIAVIVGNNGSISPSGAVTVNHGANQTFTISPDPNYHIVDVLVDGSSVGEVSSYTFDNVIEKGHTVSAVFTIDTYTIAPSVVGSGTIDPSGDQTVDHDSSKTFTITPTTGYHISEVLVDGSSVEAESPYTFSNVTENHTITASFTINNYNLTVNTVGNGEGTVTIDPIKETYDHGDEVTISATANLLSSDFAGWSGDDSDDLIENDDGTYSVTMDSDKSVTATFTLKEVTLTVITAGTGSGTVSPAEGVHTYNYGDVVTMGAIPDTGYFGTWIAQVFNIGSVFAGWSGDAEGTGDANLLMDSDKTVIATFDLKEDTPTTVIQSNQYTLTLSAEPTEGGSVSGAGTYDEGKTINISATANNDYEFVNWTGVDTTTVATIDDVNSASTTIVMNNGKTVTANFKLKKYTLTLSAEPTEGGSVSGAGTYEARTIVELTATPASGYRFDGWTGDVADPNDAETTVTMGADQTVTANFTLKTYTINATAGSGGSITPSGDVIVNYNSDQAFTIAPTTGYHIADVKIDGVSLEEVVSSYTFTNVTADHTIAATFTIDTYTLTMNKAGTGSGTVSPTVGVHTYNYGETVTITALADTGSVFDGWAGDILGSTNPTTITMNSNKNITAVFTQNEYSLTVLISPLAAETAGCAVNRSGATAPYNYGDVVTLTSDAAAGWTFDHWSGNLTGTDDPDDITIDGDKTVTAHFEAIEYTLTTSVDPDNSGTITRKVDGVINNGPYTYNTEVTLTATPEPGYYTFDHWSGDASGTNLTTTVTMNATKSAVAHFEAIEYTLTTSVDPDNSGTITRKVDGVINNGPYTYNTEVTLTATANEGYRFVNWTGDVADSNDAETTVTMSENRTVTANFIKKTYNLTISADTGGTTDPVPGTHNYEIGTVVNITATVTDSDYIFDGWTGNVADSESAETSVTMGADQTVTANFIKKTYTLTTSVDPGGSGSVTGAGTYNSGETATVKTTAASGWKFTGWSGALTGDNNPANISMDANKSVTANFARITYTLTTSVDPGGSGSVTGAGTYNSGETATVKATANTGYRFVNWTGDASGTNLTTTVIMDAAKTVTANFEPITYTLTVGVNPADNALNVVVITPSRGAHSGYAYNSTETVSIDTTTIPAGWRFVNWTDSVGGTEIGTDPTTGVMVTMDADKTVIANFIVADYYDCYAVSYPYSYDGSQTTFTYTVEELGGCQDVSYVQLNFGDSSWAVESSTRKVIFENGIKIEWKDFYETETFTITFDGRVEAEETGVLTIKTSTHEFPFTVYKPKDPYTITVSAGENGSISPSGEVTVNHGSDQSFTITPTTGYHISEVLVDEASVGTVSSYTFNNVTADHTIAATFAIDTYTITASSGSNGSISPPGEVTVNYGANQTFTIAPTTGYHIADVKIDGVSLEEVVSSYTFTNVTADHTIAATFAINTYTITVTAGANGSITPPDDQIVEHGGSQSFTIAPTTGYHIADVLVDGNPVEAESPYTFTNVTRDHIISATFAIDTYTLTVNTDGTGSGTVTADPNKATYNHGETVNISATAGADSDFDGWSGDDSDSLIDNYDGTYSITMDSDKSVNASFTRKKVKLTMSVAGTGSGSVNPTVGEHIYNYGDEITISALEDASSDFSGWSGDASGTSNVVLTMTENKDVTATFTLKTYTLTMNTAGTGSGIVTADPNKATYNHGDTVTITATADASSDFTGWSGDLSGSTNPTTITINSNKTVTAIFTLKTYTLTMNTDGTGSGTVSPTAGGHTYNYGEIVNISATAGADSDFVTWSANVAAPESATTTVTMDGDKTVTATFTLKTYTITASVVGSGSIDPSGDVTVNYGADQTFAINPDPNYHVADVLVDGGSVGAVSSYTFTNVTADHTIAATFAGDLHHFTFNNVDNQAAGTAFSIIITAKDAANNTVTSYTKKNTLSDSTGTISPTSTGSFTSGVWTGEVTITTAQAGVSITTVGDKKTGISNSFDVTAGALDHFDFAEIGNQELSIPFTIIITAKDASGNTVTDYIGTGNLTAISGLGLPLALGGFSPASTTTFGTVTAGVWTGDVTISLIGTNITITITDDVTGGTGTSNPFDVVVAVAL